MNDPNWSSSVDIEVAPTANRRSFMGYGLGTGWAAYSSLGGISGCSVPKDSVPKDSAASGRGQKLSTSQGEDLKPGRTLQRNPELVWGKLGLSDGRFQKPRAMTIDRENQLYIIDKTGRVQVFDRDGKFLRKWHTPDITNGKPTGVGINNDQLLMVADTHYFQILFYTLQGEPLPEKTIGGSNGPNVGQFAFVTDVLQDPQGNYFISEYGEFDRIQKYSSNGEFICRFGETGEGPLQFSRPQSMVMDDSGNLWISDACNHRIQVIRCEKDRPELVRIIGSQGTKAGQFRYPYGIQLGSDQSLYAAEFGNHRIQKLDLEGRPIFTWGTPGRNAGQLNQPWTLAQDSLGRIHILDSGNNRIQRLFA